MSSNEESSSVESSKQQDPELFTPKWMMPQSKIFRNPTHRAAVCIVLRPRSFKGYSEAAKFSAQQCFLESEVLLLRRAVTQRDKFPGQLCFPGGHLEAGETTLECAQRECFEECGLDLSSFYVAGRIRDRNIAILIISTLIFVQRTPKNTTEPLSLQLSEVDSCVWADYRLFVEPSMGGKYKPQHTVLDFYRFTPEAIRRQMRAMELTKLIVPCVDIAVLTGGARVTHCDVEHAVKKIARAYGCAEQDAKPIPETVKEFNEKERIAMSIGMVGLTPPLTGQTTHLPLFGLSLGVLSDANVAIGFNDVMDRMDIKWKSPILCGMKTFLCNTMYGSYDPNWTTIMTGRQPILPDWLRIPQWCRLPKTVSWCLSEKCLPCVYTCYKISTTIIYATVPKPCIQCCLICMGVPPKSERNQPKGFRRRRRPKLRPDYQTSPSPVAELDGVFSPHGKYEDTGSDDITVLKPGIWDSTRYVIANKSEQIETVDFSKMQEELENARNLGDHAKVKTIEAAIEVVNRKSFREHQIEKQKEEEKLLKNERRRHGCCYCCVIALRCEPCLGKKNKKVGVAENDVVAAAVHPKPPS